MDLLLGFGVFLSGVVLCMIQGCALYWALAAGFVCFFLVGLHRGFSAGTLLKMALKGSKTSTVVLRILVLIGVLTGLWRASGTIAYFVAMGLRVLTPRSFVMIAFLLPAVLCLAFGSSFGVSGTAGVILMTIARTGGADLAVTAGAAMSGAYFGERLSPASSAAALVSAVSGADQQEFQRQMWKDTVVPLGLTLAAYGVLSCLFPISRVDVEILNTLETCFTLDWVAALPAIVLLILPWFKVKAATAIAVSCVLSAVGAMVVQGVGPLEVLRIALLGYVEPDPTLSQVMSGGGLISMKNSVLIVFLSCSYAGIFAGTGVLEPLKDRLGALADRIGRFATQILVALMTSGLLCNQSVAIVMTREIMERHYREKQLPAQVMARELGNTVVNLAGLVPWCIACSVPLGNMEASVEALPFAVFLYLLPLWSWYRSRENKA